ncbi:RraA family protein [Rhodoplanes sp. Z2-YC6860]|uniref:RraA family protein n=1 Tax=Rhodoplanes sp. Z2-YC6860 TaxID=674703 RepID=UPI00078E7688|nr:RraA family protein [Rhodoplanes sp. Z2-YC6860]AMN44357.1 Demethylmenaquinone methyltransferase [Rhodoplanes sp. Z2-YC6860]
MTDGIDPAAKRMIRERFLAVDTSNVADVLDQMGLFDQGLAADFRPFPADAGKLAGFAYTIRGQMAPYEGTGDAAKMEACQGVGPDEISVWSGDGAGICYFGELIALGMKERGCVGALVDGGIRDVRWLGEHSFAVYARYRTAVQSIGRWRVTGKQEPVYLAGATSERVVIHPGDFVLCDEDGGIVIPAGHLMSVLEAAEELTRKEVLIRQEIASGMTLKQALDKYGHV